MSNKNKAGLLALLMFLVSGSGVFGIIPILNAVIGSVSLLPFFIWFTFADTKV